MLNSTVAALVLDQKIQVNSCLKLKTFMVNQLGQTKCARPTRLAC